MKHIRENVDAAGNYKRIYKCDTDNKAKYEAMKAEVDKIVGRKVNPRDWLASNFGEEGENCFLETVIGSSMDADVLEHFVIY